MGKIVIAEGSFLDGATLTAGSQAATLPVGNLKTIQPGEVWRATDLTKIWAEIDLGQARAIDTIGLLYANATEAATRRVRAGTTAAEARAAGPAWEIAVAQFEASSPSFQADEGQPKGIAFKSDGTKVYIIGSGSDAVRQYPLSIAWDIATAGALEASFDVSGTGSRPNAIAFKSDGTKLYVLQESADAVHQYPLGTAWDIGTAGASEGAASIFGAETGGAGLAFKSDGSKMYVTGFVSRNVHQYPLSTPWQVQTAQPVEASFDVSAQETAPQGVAFKSDGSKLFVTGSGSDTIHQYPLGTAWDISTAGAVEASLSVATQGTATMDLVFGDGGGKVYVIDQDKWQAFQYAIVPAYDSGTAAFWPTSGLDDWDFVHHVLRPASAQNFRYWRIDIADAANPDGFFDLGRLILAAAWQPTRNLQHGWGIGWIDESPEKKAIGGQSTTLERRARRLLDFSLEFLTESEMIGNAFALDRKLGRKKPILVVRDPGHWDGSGDAALAMPETVYGKQVELTPIVNPRSKHFAKRFRIEEMLP